VDPQKSVNISDRALLSLFAELESLCRGFPEEIQPFNRQSYLSHGGTRGEDYYNAAGIRAFLANTIGRLKALLQFEDAPPVTQTRSFHYVTDEGLREILQRDYQEIQRSFITRSFKSTIILSGGAMEALLLDALGKRKSDALAAKARSKGDDLSRWDLSALIAVALELEIVSVGVERLATPLREYRNLIHPGNELRNQLKFGKEEAQIAMEVLHIVDRDLSGRVRG
jgi:hypothetical protein